MESVDGRHDSHPPLAGGVPQQAPPAKGEQTQAAGCRGFASRAPEWYELANENCHITNIDGDLRIRIIDAALEK